MKKKLKLENLHIQSFVTELSEIQIGGLKGGDNTVDAGCVSNLACHNSDACPSAINFPPCHILSINSCI